MNTGSKNRFREITVLILSPNRAKRLCKNTAGGKESRPFIWDHDMLFQDSQMQIPKKEDI